MKLRSGALLVIWDESQGQYVQMPENVCLARWATGALDRFGQIDHSGGDICGREATDEVGDTPMCPHHYERAMKWLDKERDRDACEREGELHDQFAAMRVTGEWFRPERDLLDWILAQRKAPAGLPAAPGIVPASYIRSLIRDLAKLAAAPAA